MMKTGVVITDSETDRPLSRGEMQEMYDHLTSPGEFEDDSDFARRQRDTLRELLESALGKGRYAS